MQIVHGDLYDSDAFQSPRFDSHLVWVAMTSWVEIDDIRRIMEDKENAIIVASYGTFSTGISIKRLHNIIFASPSKSRIRVMQSIGRQLRLSKYKEKAILFDIADDLSWKTWKNHTLKHHQARVKMYSNENFNYKIIHIKDKGV